MNSPEKQDDDPTPPRRNRSEMDANERQLWDLEDGNDLLDDDFLQPKAVESTKLGHEGTNEDEQQPLESEKEPVEEYTPPKSAIEEDLTPSLSHIEKISLGVFGILILAIAIWLLSLFFRELPTSDPTSSANFPVQGAYLVVDEITTYWRKPTQKDRGVKTSAKVIPAGSITLGKGNGQGALRFFFEDSEGDLIGDVFTFAILNGQFSGNKNNTIEINASDGFSDLGDLPGYLTGQIDLWYMIVKEGPSPDAKGSEFQEILRLPIERERR